MNTQHLFGLDFVTGVSIPEVADRVLAPAVTDGWRIVVTPNVDHLVRYRRHPDDAAVAANASMVLPDGMPIVWASRLLHRPLSARLAGSDLFVEVWNRLARDGRPVVVLASRQQVADGLAAEHPGADIVVAPQFAAEDAAAFDAAAADIAARVAASGAQVVLIGVGVAATHRLAAALAGQPVPAGSPTVLLVGASAEFHLGLKQRAPRWMQRAGVEWLYRLLSEPRRLARRYLVDDVAFFPMVWREWRTSRARAR